MSAALQAHCRRLERAMDATAKAINTISAVPIPYSTPGHANLSLLRNLQAAFAIVPLEFPDIATTAVTVMQAKHTFFVYDLTNLIPLLVTELCRHSNAAAKRVGSGSTEEDVFWNLWKLLYEACARFCKWPDVWAGPGPRRPFLPRLSIAFYEMLMWLLPLIRSPAWRAMRPQHGVASRNQELQSMLKASMLYLTHVSTAPPLHIISHLKSIPPDYVPLLSCIVSEQFGTHPVPISLPKSNTGFAAPALSHTLASIHAQPSTRYDVFYDLLGVIKIFTSSQRDPQHAAVFAFLKAPSVIHALKAILLLPVQTPPSKPSLIRNAMSCLENVLRSSVKEHGDGFEASVIDDDENNNKIQKAIPWHPNPLLCPSILATDVRLLHILGGPMGARHRSSDSELIALSQGLQIEILISWFEASRLCIAPKAARRVVKDSFIGMVKQCSMDVLEWMQGMRVLRSCEDELLQGPQQPPPQLQQQQQQQQVVTKTADARLGMLTGKGMADTRLMFSALSISKLATVVGQDIDPSELHTRHTWCGMAGWAVVAEALCRGRHHPRSAADVKQPNICVGQVLSLLGSCPNSSTLMAHVSLAATFRKLLFPFVQQESIKEVKSRRELWECQPHMRTQWQKQQAEDCKEFDTHEFVEMLTTSITALNHLHDVGQCDSGSSSGSSSSSTSTSTISSIVSSSKSIVSNSSSSSSSVVSGSSSSNSINNSDASNDAKQVSCQASLLHGSMQIEHICPPADKGVCNTKSEVTSLAQVLHKLQANMVLTLSQLCLWKLECEEEWANSERLASNDTRWLDDVLQVCSELPYVGLKELMNLLVSRTWQSDPRAQAGAGVLWEAYAYEHFHGRLTPGCCNQRCTNLSGVSESYVKTQLCGGCRMARYCSVACQRAAWSEGGHSTVCGSSCVQ